jgi:hypothetical protein
MKPRRDNGGVLVSPITSDVRRGSALIGLLLNVFLRGCASGFTSELRP